MRDRFHPQWRIEAPLKPNPLNNRTRWIQKKPVGSNQNQRALTLHPELKKFPRSLALSTAAQYHDPQRQAAQNQRPCRGLRDHRHTKIVEGTDIGTLEKFPGALPLAILNQAFGLSLQVSPEGAN
jgi:hypothetical protein